MSYLHLFLKAPFRCPRWMPKLLSCLRERKQCAWTSFSHIACMAVGVITAFCVMLTWKWSWDSLVSYNFTEDKRIRPSLNLIKTLNREIVIQFLSAVEKGVSSEHVQEQSCLCFMELNSAVSRHHGRDFYFF